MHLTEIIQSGDVMIFYPEKTDKKTMERVSAVGGKFGKDMMALPFALLRMFLPWCCIRTRSGKKSPSESMHLSLMRKCARCKGAL